MLRTVYADVLFLIDFTMDFLAVYLTSHFIKRKTDVRRMIFSALIGALYSVLTVIFKLDSLLLTLLVAVLICLKKVIVREDA